MENELFIHDFLPILPGNQLPQEKIVDWLVKAHRRSETVSNPAFESNDFERKLRRFCLSQSHISKRYFEYDDADEDWEAHKIYKITAEEPDGVGMGERNRFFSGKVLGILEKIYPHDYPQHLVHVTCTGYVSPSPPQRYFGERNSGTQITHAYHMGCYASLPSIRIAAGISHREGMTVDVLHTEMCSLHLSPSSHTPEQMVVQSLFADGHIRYKVGPHASGMRIMAIMEKIIPDTHEDMTWIPDKYGMKMTLSRTVPAKIKDNLPGFLIELAKKSGTEAEELIRDAIFAVHPGGPKIIEAVQKKLELSDSQVAASNKVLYERGNMSSATLPHVWHEIWASGVEDKRKIVSLAFGPGLTVFGAVFEVRR